MHKVIRIVTTTMLSAVALLPGIASAAAPQAPAAVRSNESAAIDDWVEGRMDARSLPGAAVAVVRNGHVVHLAGYGTADEAGRPVAPDTPFILGSTSKPFTAVVVGQLVEEGALTWDQPVWPYLSHLVDAAPEGFEAVTVEQLLTHTAGLGMTHGTAGTVKIHDGANALDRRVDELLSKSLARPPSESFVYSNTGFMLLAAVVEQVTGRSFADELRDRVFEPLGMTDTFARGDDPRAADMATGHQQWFGRWRPVELPYDDAGVAMGYIASTAADLAKFMQAHLEGHPAIPASAAEIAGGPVTPTGWTTTLDAGYGHGWFVDELAGTPVVSHPGSLGHFTAQVLLAPGADGLGIAVVSNASSFVSASHEAQYDLGLGLTHLLLGEEPQPAEPSRLMSLAVPILLWLIVALLVGGVVRYLFRLRGRGLPAVKGHGARRWIRTVLPGAVYLAIGAGLMTAAPLGLARHFYPDGGWAVTAMAYVTVAWGLARLGVGFVAMRRTGRPGSADMPDHTSAGADRLDRDATPQGRHAAPLPASANTTTKKGTVMTAKTRNANTETARPYEAPATARAHDSSWIPGKAAARIIGVLILAGWFTYGPGGAVVDSIVTAPDTLTSVAANQPIFTLGAVVMLLNSAAVVGIGVMWFPVLKRYSEPVALSYLATRVLEAAILAVGIMSLLSLTALSESYVAVDAAAGAHFEALGTVAVHLSDLAYQIGMATLGFGSLFFCYLLFRTALVPRMLAAWGFIGYAVFALGMMLEVFGLGVGLLLTIPGGLFELVFAAWLIVKGFQPSATDRVTAVASVAAQGVAR